MNISNKTYEEWNNPLIKKYESKIYTDGYSEGYDDGYTDGLDVL